MKIEFKIKKVKENLRTLLQLDKERHLKLNKKFRNEFIHEYKEKVEGGDKVRSHKVLNSGLIIKTLWDLFNARQGKISSHVIDSKPYTEDKFNKYSHTTRNVSIGALVGIAAIFFAFIIFNSLTQVIERNDRVRVEITIWGSDQYRSIDVGNPLEPNSVLYIDVIPRNDTSDGSGTILGLYNNLVGRQVGYQSGRIWLNKCVDVNLDGYDDDYGHQALSYGRPTDLYFGQCLYVQFKVVGLDKQAAYQPTIEDQGGPENAPFELFTLETIPIIFLFLLVVIALTGVFTFRRAERFAPKQTNSNLNKNRNYQEFSE